MIENHQVKDQHLQSLIYNTSDFALFIIDNKGNIQTWNRGAKYIFGYRDGDIIGKNFSVFYKDEHQQKKLPETLLELAKKKSKAIKEGKFVRKNSKVFWGSIIISSILNEKKLILGFSVVIQDLTKLKESEDKFRSLLEFAPDAMIAINSKGIILMANQQMENIFGYMRKEIIGLKMEVLLPEQFRKKHLDLRNSYAEKPYSRSMNSEMELFGLRKDGEEFPVEVSLSPLKTNGETLIMAAIRDITPKKELISKLIEAKEKAEESDRLKSTFLSTMSHELRTPLNHILGLSDLIPDMTDDDSVKEFSNLIHKSGTDLLSMIEDILDLAILESKDMNLRNYTFNIGELFGELK